LSKNTLLNINASHTDDQSSQALPHKRGISTHLTLLITPSHPQWVITLIL